MPALDVVRQLVKRLAKNMECITREIESTDRATESISLGRLHLSSMLGTPEW